MKQDLKCLPNVRAEKLFPLWSSLKFDGLSGFVVFARKSRVPTGNATKSETTWIHSRRPICHATKTLALTRFPATKKVGLGLGERARWFLATPDMVRQHSATTTRQESQGRSLCTDILQRSVRDLRLQSADDPPPSI